MEISLMDFMLGFILGGAVGAGIMLAVARIRRWLGRSEAGRLAAENRDLKRRLAAKDRHVAKMLAETARLADKLGKTPPQIKEDDKLIESKRILAVTQEGSK
jgi:hypothetical protein